jgi:hypothetical protein
MEGGRESGCGRDVCSEATTPCQSLRALLNVGPLVLTGIFIGFEMMRSTMVAPITSMFTAQDPFILFPDNPLWLWAATTGLGTLGYVCFLSRKGCLVFSLPPISCAVIAMDSDKSQTLQLTSRFFFFFMICFLLHFYDSESLPRDSIMGSHMSLITGDGTTLMRRNTYL